MRAQGKGRTPVSDDPVRERVERAIEAFRQGRMVILVDDEDRENEGDLCLAAEKTTAEAVNFMAKEARGLICLSLDEDRIKQLRLPMMVAENESSFQTAFTVSIEAAKGVTTGISAADRAHTIQTAVADHARPEDLVRPGHVFPLRARKGGVLVRTGQTEGSVDLARLAGLKPAAVICEIMNDDGTMARMPQLEVFGEKHGIPILSIADLVKYRLEHERLVVREGREELHLGTAGTFKAYSYRVPGEEGRTHIALVKGDVSRGGPVLARVHAMCTAGDVLGSTGCDCGLQLRRAIERIGKEGRGVIVYLEPEDRGGAARLRCSRLSPEEGRARDKSTGSFRSYGVGAQILRDLGVKKLRLLTNNPKKLVGLAGYGLEVTGRVAIEVPATRVPRSYLLKKRDMGHLIRVGATRTTTSTKTPKTAKRKGQ
jgi:3,4-dihydroxy 2-butanone 4-phosphate synthase/GTP cyclohydrolase II